MLQQMLGSKTPSEKRRPDLLITALLLYPASKLSYLGKRGEPRENARAWGRGFLCPSHIKILFAIITVLRFEIAKLERGDTC